jgi:hypothetical protein
MKLTQTELLELSKQSYISFDIIMLESILQMSGLILNVVVICHLNMQWRDFSQRNQMSIALEFYC